MGVQIKTGGDPSMFETVKKHGELIEAHDQSINELKENYKKLERNDLEHQQKLDTLSNQMADLKTQNTELENTILKDNRETRSTLNTHMENLFKLTENAMGYQSSKSNQQHELKMMKWKTMADVFFKICGAFSVLGASGGIIYMIFEHFFSK